MDAGDQFHWTSALHYPSTTTLVAKKGNNMHQLTQKSENNNLGSEVPLARGQLEPPADVVA
jgi:hypothetical protein